jgi:hypothetical protein
MVEMQRQQIAGFIKETTSLVVEWGFDAPSMHKEMLQLHEIIGQLIKERFRTEDVEATIVQRGGHLLFFLPGTGP